jgi:hypothetical protein
LKLLNKEERFLSSAMETWRESLKMTSGSGLVEMLREDMLVKQEDGYRVTSQTVLIDSAGFDEERYGDSSGSLFDSWINVASAIPMIRVKRRMDETLKMRVRRFEALCCW